jgi:hypothetical protein
MPARQNPKAGEPGEPICSAVGSPRGERIAKATTTHVDATASLASLFLLIYSL